MIRGGIIVCLLGIVAPWPPAGAQEPARAKLPDGPRWYKGNLHTHSLWSDGNDYPEMIADKYRSQGYHFLSLTDHNLLGSGRKWINVAEADKRAKAPGLARYRERFGNDWVETRESQGELQVRLKPFSEYAPIFNEPGRFLLLPGEEITDQVDRRPIHLNAANLAAPIEPRGGRRPSEALAADLAAVEEQSQREGRAILVQVNHPNFGYALRAEDLALVGKARFFEVFNGHPEVHNEGDHTHASTERIWDIVNTLRLGEMRATPIFGLATDDAHNYFGPNGPIPGRGWVQVRARNLTPESLVQAMLAGDFYASSGVTLRELRYDPESRWLSLEVEPEADAQYTIQFIGTLKDYDRSRQTVEGISGRPLFVTKRYSKDVGRVLETVEGTSARYHLTGDELYVRAVVTSTLPAANPITRNQVRQAWTQPVGWERRVVVEATDP